METTPPTGSFNDFGYRKRKRAPESEEQDSARPPRRPYGPRAEGANGNTRKPYGGGEGGGFRKPYGPRAEGAGGGERPPFRPRKPYGDGDRPVWRKEPPPGESGAPPSGGHPETD